MDVVDVPLDATALNRELSYDTTATATDPPLDPNADAILIDVEELAMRIGEARTYPLVVWFEELFPILILDTVIVTDGETTI